jgi:hypothetical protein
MPSNRIALLKILLLSLGAVSTSDAQTPSSSRATTNALSQFRVVPRILVGKDWETLIVLLNPGQNPVSFQQAFFADGKPVALAIGSESLGVNLTTPAIQGSVSPGARVTLALGTPDQNVQEVWSLLSYAQGALDGYTVLRRRAQAGDFSFEATMPLSGTQDLNTYLPFDNTQGFRSQVTLVNPASDISATVRLTYLNTEGGTVLIDSVLLTPAQQLTFILPDTYPDLANKAGGVLIETDTDRLSVFGLRQNVRYGVISALPAIAGRPALR